MKQVFLVSHSDQWLSNNSFRTIGIASSLKKAVDMAREDLDAVADVILGEGCVVISSVTLNERDSDSQVLVTQNDEDKFEIIKLRINTFLKEFGERVRSNESDDYVELMMDDHICIEFNEKQYYIPENNSSYTSDDEEIVELLADKFHV